jgi:hypothetical protein
VDQNFKQTSRILQFPTSSFLYVRHFAKFLHLFLLSKLKTCELTHIIKRHAIAVGEIAQLTSCRQQSTVCRYERSYQFASSTVDHVTVTASSVKGLPPRVLMLIEGLVLNVVNANTNGSKIPNNGTADFTYIFCADI